MRERNRAQGSYFGVGGGVHDKRTDWNWAQSRSWRALAGNRRFPGRGRCILCAVVLVAAVVAGISRRRGGCGAMALDCGCAFGVGFAVALRCVWDFGWTGHGTPAPIAPPKRLVVVGFYRYVRNPMYLGFFAGWIGLWVVFGRANLAAIAVACVIVLGVVLFVLLYEEPHLRRIFGAEYEEYCRNVRRWVPRMRAWDK